MTTMQRESLREGVEGHGEYVANKAVRCNGGDEGENEGQVGI